MLRYILVGCILVNSARAGTFVDTGSFATSFEQDEWIPVQQGNLDELPQWDVAAGQAWIVTNDSIHGRQALMLESNTVASLAYTGETSVLWVDLHLRLTDTPPGAPTNYIPPEPRSSVLSFFDGSVWALDGDGSGYGIYTNVAPDIFLTPVTPYIRITLRQDYVDKCYDVWINRELRASGLGFKDVSVEMLSLLRRTTGDTPSFIDDITITPYGLDLDLDEDGLPDLDEIRHGFHPDFPDRDGDGRTDPEAYAAEMAIRGPGYRLDPDSLPADGRTVLHVSPRGHDLDLSFPSRRDFLYRLEQSTDLPGDAWDTAPGFGAGIPGEDATVTWPLDIVEPYSHYRLMAAPRP